MGGGGFVDVGRLDQIMVRDRIRFAPGIDGAKGKAAPSQEFGMTTLCRVVGCVSRIRPLLSMLA